MVDHMLQQLDPALTSSCEKDIRALFSRLTRSTETLLCFAGDIIDMKDQCCLVNILSFREGRGIDLASKGEQMVIQFPPRDPRMLRFVVGSSIQVIFPVWDRDPGRCSLDTKTIVLPIPDLEKCLSWNMIHLFAGGFCGWSHAASWLNSSDLNVGIATEVAIDSDWVAAHTLAKTHGIQVREGPFRPATPSEEKCRVFCCPIQDLQILQELTFLDNVAMTMSPPCISWSLGGKETGLESLHGRSFLEAIELVGYAQPLFVSAECADIIVNHGHYKVILAAFNALGYKLLWSQVVHYHTCAPMHRSRWLATWVRQDVPAFCLQVDFRLQRPGVPQWTSPLFQCRLPDCVSEQLVLPDSIKAIYADRQLLPKAKAAGLAPNAPSHDVLLRRLPARDQPFCLRFVPTTPSSTCCPQTI